MPALNARGISNARGLSSVGVFTEVDVDKKAVIAKPKIGTPDAPVSVWVLIAHPAPASFVNVSVDHGEIEVMRELGMAPVFFGRAVAGPNLPHLRYITCGPDPATHLGNWKNFGTHPTWNKLKADPQYKDNTSKNTARFPVPAAGSQI